MPILTILHAVVLMTSAVSSAAFCNVQQLPVPSSRNNVFVVWSSSSSDFSNNDVSNDNNDDDNLFYIERYKRRMVSVQERIDNEIARRPPNNIDLNPYEVITEILNGLREPDEPYFNFGFQILLQSSTRSWRNVLHQSVGAPSSSQFQQQQQQPLLDDNDNKDGDDSARIVDDDNIIDDVVVASALREAFNRPNNQFRILLGTSSSSSLIKNNDDTFEEEEEEFKIEFPSDIVEYEDDGTCWVECRLRSKEDDTLLAVLGWTLQKEQKQKLDKNDDDSTLVSSSYDTLPWLIDSIDWQDFREKYRPGIGREEWERICG